MQRCCGILISCIILIVILTSCVEVEDINSSIQLPSSTDHASHEDSVQASQISAEAVKTPAPVQTLPNFEAIETPEPVPALTASPAPNPSKKSAAEPIPTLSPVKPATHYISKMVIRNGSAKEGKRAALTFDDGPDNNFTGQILDILKKYDLKATFFIVGRNAEKYPDVVRRIQSEGHAIGNHSWNHPNFNKLSEEQIQEQLTKTDDILKKITGNLPLLFRAPYGELTQTAEKELQSSGHSVIGWSVDTRDWAGTDVTSIMDLVAKEIRPGGIILQHCAGGTNGDLSNTVEALPEIIESLQSQGYTFITVPELLSIQEIREDAKK